MNLARNNTGISERDFQNVYKYAENLTTVITLRTEAKVR